MGCYEDLGSPKIVNPAVLRAVELIKEVYRYNHVGGNAHIVLDDWNIDDEDVEKCLQEWIPENMWNADADQLKAESDCMESLLSLSEEERASALAIFEGLFNP